MKRSTVLALVAAACAGCFESHQLVPDGSAATDAGDRPDAMIEECPFIGEYRACDPLCSTECPRDTARVCGGYRGVCLPNQTVFDEPRGGRSCYYRPASGPGSRNTAGYCWDGGICAVRPDEIDRGRWRGGCMTADYCRAAPEFGVEARCYYSDHTWFVDGPPELEECPAPTDPDTPFCGGPCGECPWHTVGGATPSSDYEVSCVGISDRRAVGVCTFGLNYGCDRNAAWDGTDCERSRGRPCACMTLRDATGAELERGWVTYESSCLAYRAMDPEGVVCHDPRTWEVLGE